MNAPVVVIDVVGLTPSLLGEDTPHLNRVANEGFVAPVNPVVPAVTCSSQASILTGKMPREHGIVANGWYFRDLAEVWFWRQSNRLVQGDKLWETARRARPGLRCAKMFWWYNMYSSADVGVTPRPLYPADGRKLPSIYSKPLSLEHSLQEELGTFPLFNFWGPTADITSSAWIAEASARIFERNRPELMLVYLPHLDYNLQRLGPNDPAIREDVRAIDRVVGKLIDRVRAHDAEVVVLSEYGIEPATGVVHINRVLREAGLLEVRETLGFELLDWGASRAFAVADHQLAHVYVNDPADVPKVADLLREQKGIERVLDREQQASIGIDHERAGELVALAQPGHWFTYYFWLDDARAPDFARCVDIHRKPGYDPVELFLDPDRPLIKGRVLWTLAKKKAGFRYLMDVIPLKADLVRGTHGRPPARPEEGPLVMATNTHGAADHFEMTDLHGYLLKQLAAG